MLFGSLSSRTPQPRSHRQAGCRRHGPIAQLVERTADNREVSGSNPLRPTNPRTSGAVAQLGERLVCNQEVAGSNPVSSTRPERLEGEQKKRRQRPAVPNREGRAVASGHGASTPLRDESARGSLTTEDPYKARRDVVHDYSVSSSVNAVVKLLRAYGGCLGAGRR